MPKKKIASKKALKKQSAKKSLAKQRSAKKQTKKRVPAKKAAKKQGAKQASRSVARFPSASSLKGLREEHVAGLATVTALVAGVDDPPGCCVTVDSSGRMSYRITRQSMCTGPNSRFFPHKACPA
jgi:hypothetical protein